MAAKNLVEFDYERSRTDYMKRINKMFDEDSTHSPTVIQRTISLLKSSSKSHLHKNYCISYAFGREILLEKKKKAADPDVQVLSYEDFFDIFIRFHVGNSHLGGRNHLIQMEKNLVCNYRYPALCLSLLINSCNVCNSRSLKRTGMQQKVCSVYVTVMVRKCENPNFKNLLIYIDKATDFVVLRPLTKKSDLEVAMEIFKIQMQFGPPSKLRLCGYNKDFNRKVGSCLRVICPKFDFSIEYKSADFDPPAVVLDKVHEWMTKNYSVAWELGCSIVQNNLNMTKGNKGLTPHDLFFGKIHSAKSGIQPGINQVKFLRQPNEPNIIILEKKVISAEAQAQQLKNVGTGVCIDDDDIVELRIPSPEHYDIDLLSQFEDSEISQEQTDRVVLNKNKTKNMKYIVQEGTKSEVIVNGLNVRLNVKNTREPQEIQSKSETSTMKTQRIKGSRKREHFKTITTKQNTISHIMKPNPLDGGCTSIPKPTPSDPLASLRNLDFSSSDSGDSWQLEPPNLQIKKNVSDIDKKLTIEQEHANRETSISSAIKVNINLGNNMNDLQIDEDMIFDPNFDELPEDNLDPFSMVEEIKEENIQIIMEDDV